MERLTRRHEDGALIAAGVRITGNRAATRKRYAVKLAKRLEQYEDTGLSPDQFKEAARLLKAKENGKLVELPVPVGKGRIAFGVLDDLYTSTPQIMTIECDYATRLAYFPSGNVYVEVDGWEISQSDIGKTVFLTREEAEKKMERKHKK